MVPCLPLPVQHLSLLLAPVIKKILSRQVSVKCWQSPHKGWLETCTKIIFHVCKKTGLQLWCFLNCTMTQELMHMIAKKILVNLRGTCWSEIFQLCQSYSKETKLKWLCHVPTHFCLFLMILFSLTIGSLTRGNDRHD